MENKIFGMDSIIEKKAKVEFQGIEYEIKEMNVLHYLKFLKGEYNTENLEGVVDLVNDCSNKNYDMTSIEDADLYVIIFLFNAVIDLQTDKNAEEKVSDYNYQIDYSYNVAKVMKEFSYTLEYVYKLPHSVFVTLQNHLSTMETAEDIRTVRILTNMEARKIKGDTTFKDFIRGLHDNFKKVMNTKKTAKANAKAWKVFHGISEIKKELNKP